MTDPTDNLSFATLDRLLDEALELKGQALEVFLAALPTEQQAALYKLLDKSGTDALGPIAATAQRVATTIRRADKGGVKAGEWLLKKEIGSGGTGQVFYAERHEQKDANTQDGDTFVQKAAVKVLWSHRVRSQFKDRFLRERRILASIDHPGLARFLDGGLLGDGRPWFAMEYVDGKDIVSFSRPLPVNERLRLFVQIADTINFAHQRLIVHRDIKPQNILVDSFNTPRVLDFGIAGMLGGLDQQSLTEDQGTPLTLQYASPEQVGGASVDVASDVYQLGLLLFEILTGAKPYQIDDQSLQVSVETIRSKVPVAPGVHDERISKDIDAIVSKALRKDPAVRYASAAAMRDDVQRFLDGRPILARAQSRWYVFSRFIRRNALVAGVVAASFVGLGFATAYSVNRAAEARAEAERSRITQQILADVFEQADPFGDGGAELTLAEALIRAKPSIKQQVAHDPRLEWEVNRTLVEIFTNLDLIDLEKEALQTAWEAAKKLKGDNERERLFAIAGLGNILARTDPAEGVAFFDEHLPRSPASSRGASDWLSAKYAQVSALIRLREDEKADLGAKEMASVAREFGVDTPRTLGRIEQLLAGTARRAGDIDAADAHWSAAVGHMRRAEAPLSLAVTLSNQALHYGMTQRYPESETAFQESVEIFQRYEPDNTSHANVLRLYAGLLFRTGRPDDAQAALDSALQILDSSKHGYAVFVAQLNRANFAFASGDTSKAIDAVEQGLQVALPAFGAESDVTRRMSPTLARLLIFAGRDSEAANLVFAADKSNCETKTRMYDAVELVFSKDTRVPGASGRDLFRQTIERLDEPVKSSALRQSELDDAMQIYRSSSDVFVNVLDRHQFIQALHNLASVASIDLPADLRSELERLQKIKAHTAAQMQARSHLQSQIDALSTGYLELCSSF
ncbi:MAG: serine/threonine-protein kinase [Pseudomonadota bacterium]